MDVSDAPPARAATYALLEALPQPAALFSPRLELEYANSRFCAFSGLSRDAAKNRETRMSLVHPEDLRVLNERWSEALESGRRFEIETRVRRATGDYRVTHLEVTPMRAGDEIAYWLGTATDVEEVRRSEALFAGITEAAPQFIWVSRPDGVFEFWNRRLREYTGLAPDAATGIDWTQIVHPAEADAARAAYADALRHETHFEIEYRLRRHDGTYRWFLGRAEPARDAEGRVMRWIGTATDIEEHKQAESAMRLLLDATTELGVARELDVTLPMLTDRIVASFAESAVIFRRSREGWIEPIALSSDDPARSDVLRDLLRMYPPRKGYVANALTRNESALVASIEETHLERAAEDSAHLALLRKAGLRSAVVAPLTTRGEAIGVLVAMRCGRLPPFEHRDLATAQILANRIAGAIDEAATRESERRLAETFQASALPRRLPDLPGIEVRAMYQAAEVGINVGGDWYDAFEVSPWRLVVSVGDVAGKGADAAAAMSLIRHGIRFAAHRGQDPADILAVVDRALRAEDENLTASAFVAIVDVRESRVHYASAGHPPGALRLPDGRVRMLAVEPAPPLGAWSHAIRPRVETCPLVYGSLLVLYTDGLTEIERDPIAGERTLISVLHDDGAFASTNPARFVRDAVIAQNPVRDDVAVITVAYGRREGWTFEAADALRAQPARGAFERWLTERAEGDRYAAILIFGELVGNVVRHAPGPIEIRAEWRDEKLLLHVFDTGRGFDAVHALPDVSSEGGRGLFIVRMLARTIALSRTPRGSRVTVTLPVTRRAPAER